MANLDTQIERTGKILNDIKEAIEGHGLDLEGVSPVNYSDKIKEIATVSVQEFGRRPVILFKRAETEDVIAAAVKNFKNPAIIKLFEENEIL